MSHGYLLRATYASGYVLAEDGADRSPYDPGRNVFHAVLAGRPTGHGHGPLTRLELVPDRPDGRRTWYVDWGKHAGKTDPRPIVCRRMRRRVEGPGVAADEPAWAAAQGLGVQWRDETGANRQTIAWFDPATGSPVDDPDPGTGTTGADDESETA